MSTVKDLQQFFGENDLIMEPDKVRWVLETAIINEVMLELTFDRNPQIYTAHLWQSEKQTRKGGLKEDPFLYVSPLEPLEGNDLITNCRQIRLSFILGTHAVGAAVSLNKVVKLHGKPAWKLNAPSTLNARIRRNAYRYLVPAKPKTRVTILRKRDDKGVEGLAKDIHMEGMCFITPPMERMFELNETVQIQVTPEAPGLLEFTTPAEVRYGISVRHRQRPELVLHRYGVRFHDIGDYYSLTKFVKAIKAGGKAEPQVDLYAMMESVFSDDALSEFRLPDL